MILMAQTISEHGRAVSRTSRRFLVDILSASAWLGWDLIKKSTIYAFTLWILVYKNTELLNRCPCPSGTGTCRDNHACVRDVINEAHFVIRLQS